MASIPSVRSSVWVGVCLVLGVAEGFAIAEPIKMEPGRRQLFLDDYVVQEMVGLKRTLHQPEKRGAVVRPDIASDGCMVQARSAPMWIPEEQVYKLLYVAYTLPDAKQIGPALAVSKDGIHWEKPIIGEVEVRGSKENNRIVVDTDETWPENAFFDVLYDPDDPDPNRRYKGLRGATSRRPCVSPDCIHWTTLDVPAIPSSDVSQFIYDPGPGRFMVMVKGSNEFGRAFNVAFSEDFDHWTKPRFLFGADAEDQPRAKDIIQRRLSHPGMAKPLNVDPDPDSGWTPPGGKLPHAIWRAECYNIAVFPYEGVYVGMPQLFHPTGIRMPERNNTDGFHVIQLAVTRDLEHWERVCDRAAFLETSLLTEGLVGNFDRLQLGVTNHPVQHGDELWFYYSGLKYRVPIYDRYLDGRPRGVETLSPAERADLEDGWGALCLAVLRRDGFVSLDASEEGGSVLTKPLVMNGDGLYLNLAAAGGEAQVEVLGADGNALPGFALEEAVPVTGDGVRLRVGWKSGERVAALAGQTVSVRVHLKGAQLYSFWTE